MMIYDIEYGMCMRKGEFTILTVAGKYGESVVIDKDIVVKVIDKIAVWKENSIVLIDLSVILYFTASKKKVAVHTKDGIFESNSSLECLEIRLSDRGFFRCHRSFIINMEHVDQIVPWFNSTYMMKLKTTPEQIPVGRHYTRKLRDLLNI